MHNSGCAMNGHYPFPDIGPGNANRMMCIAAKQSQNISINVELGMILFFPLLLSIGKEKDANEGNNETPNQQINYAQLDLSQPSTNNTFLSMTNGGSNRLLLSQIDSNGQVSMNKNTDFGQVANGANLTMIPNGGIIPESEYSEYTHIDLPRTNAYLASKQQNDTSACAIPEDRVASCSTSKEASNPLSSVLKTVLQPSSIISNVTAKRNSVISN